MYTVDSSIKETDKLNIFSANNALNLPSILRSIKRFEQNFYENNANRTKHKTYPLKKELRGKIQQKKLLTKDGVQIDVWDINIPKNNDYVIFCQGISSEKSNPLLQAAYVKILCAGKNVITFDYRGKGKSSGTFSKEGTKYDMLAVYKYLTAKGVPASKIGVIGHSLGSAVAAAFSADFQTSFTILINPFSKASDMAKQFAKVAAMPDIVRKIIQKLPNFLIPLKNSFDNEKSIRKIKSPLCIIHTKDDNVIPVELAKKLYLKSQNNSAKYFELENGEHELNDEKIDCCIDFMRMSGKNS